MSETFSPPASGRSNRVSLPRRGAHPQGQQAITAPTTGAWHQERVDGESGAPHPTVLTTEQEAIIVASRKRTLLALDDCLYALQAIVLLLTRSSLHRCLQRHGISRLPDVEGDKPAKKKFAKYAIGYFHVDIAEVCTEQGRLYLFVAIDRTSKFAYAELHPDQTRITACQFLCRLTAAVLYRIHIVLMDNGIQFTPKSNKRSRLRTDRLSVLKRE